MANLGCWLLSKSLYIDTTHNQSESWWTLAMRSVKVKQRNRMFVIVSVRILDVWSYLCCVSYLFTFL